MSKRRRKVAFQEELEVQAEKRQKNEGDEAYEEDLDEGRSEWALFRM